MSKKSSLKRITIHGIMEKIRLLINPSAALPEVSGDDPLAIKLAQLQMINNDLLESHEEQVQQLGKINQVINELTKLLKSRVDNS